MNKPATKIKKYDYRGSTTKEDSHGFGQRKTLPALRRSSVCEIEDHFAGLTTFVLTCPFFCYYSSPTKVGSR